MSVDVSAQHRTMVPARSGLLITLSVIALMLFIRADRAAGRMSDPAAPRD
jgi:hypothetical protein